jgi:hypothetical protein
LLVIYLFYQGSHGHIRSHPIHSRNTAKHIEYIGPSPLFYSSPDENIIRKTSQDKFVRTRINAKRTTAVLWSFFYYCCPCCPGNYSTPFYLSLWTYIRISVVYVLPLHTYSKRNTSVYFVSLLFTSDLAEYYVVGLFGLSYLSVSID